LNIHRKDAEDAKVDDFSIAVDPVKINGTSFPAMENTA